MPEAPSSAAPLDCLVIGGGPAGATAATCLAQRGRRVVLLERERFPRYKVGESLLPYCYFILERLGLVDALQRSHFTRKHGVQFVTPDGTQSSPVYFEDTWDHPAAVTWQVSRSEFDQLLLDNARSKGVDVREGWSATAPIEEEGAVRGVVARDPEGETHTLRAPITIDASGRDALFMRHYKWRNAEPPLSRMALWAYYEGAGRQPGRDEGHTTICMLPDNDWIWYIPMHDDRVSVGVVGRHARLYREGKDIEAIFEREVATNPWVHEKLTQGRRVSEIKVTADYSYRAQHCAADGVVLAGDAFGFLDPVFSSGVFMALMSGERAADAVHQALEDGRSDAAAFTAYGEEVCQGMEIMRKLVYAFYDSGFSFGRFIKRFPELRDDLTEGLIGNFARDYQALFTAVAELGALPEPLSYGRNPQPSARG